MVSSANPMASQATSLLRLLRFSDSALLKKMKVPKTSCVFGISLMAFFKVEEIHGGQKVGIQLRNALLGVGTSPCWRSV